MDKEIEALLEQLTSSKNIVNADRDPQEFAMAAAIRLEDLRDLRLWLSMTNEMFFRGVQLTREEEAALATLRAEDGALEEALSAAIPLLRQRRVSVLESTSVSKKPGG